MNKEIKTFFIKTYGCQMNELDSEVIAGILKRRGLQASDDENSADILIFNTCSIRDLAERKALGKIGMLSRKREDNPIIGIMGCMANSKKQELFKKLPHLDFVLGTNNIDQLDEVLNEIIEKKNSVIKVDEKFERELEYSYADRNDHLKAFVSIIRGCNNFCTYCIVPYTRGREVSRSAESILKECQQLADKGYKEITLLGQNVNSYGKDMPEHKYLFHDLLYDIDKIKGIERIRFMTSHPVDISTELMYAVRDLPSLCEFIHFPMQAGSDKILKKMNRKYTFQEYIEKIKKFREIVPNVSLGTDIIVGFPGETDEDFEKTYQAMKEIEYSTAFIFAYSPRTGTVSARWKDDVPKQIKDERLQRLLVLQNDIYAKHRQNMLGETVEVLVESISSRNKNILKGRSRCWKSVLFPGNKSLIGTIQNIKVHSFNHQTLLGDIIPKNHSKNFPEGV